LAETIYLDNNATTPIDPRVLEAMLPYFQERFGNASSKNHVKGWEAESAVEDAREKVASILNANPKEIIWTSGATESANIAILGAARVNEKKGKHLITQTTEHKAALEPCRYLEQNGWEVTYLPVDSHGRISAEQVAEAIRADTALVSIMFANNEIGTVQPISEIGQVCKERGILLHTDATQAIGKVPVDVEEMGIDLLSCSAHKFYGPKGVGALYLRRRRPRVRCMPIIHGSGQERGLRSGTLNVPGIVGMGRAAEIAEKELDNEPRRQEQLRDRLWQGLSESLEDLHHHGDPVHGLPNTLSVSFAYVEGQSLMMAMDPIAVSSGAACDSNSDTSSHVLKALGVPEELARGSIRFSLGRFTTSEHIERTIAKVIDTVRHQRSISPLYELNQEGLARNS
jgi:cysteine desulfurase